MRINLWFVDFTGPYQIDKTKGTNYNLSFILTYEQTKKCCIYISGLSYLLIIIISNISNNSSQLVLNN